MDSHVDTGNRRFVERYGRIPLALCFVPVLTPLFFVARTYAEQGLAYSIAAYAIYVPLLLVPMIVITLWPRVCRWLGLDSNSEGQVAGFRLLRQPVRRVAWVVLGSVLSGTAMTIQSETHGGLYLLTLPLSLAVGLVGAYCIFQRGLRLIPDSITS